MLSPYRQAAAAIRAAFQRQLLDYIMIKCTTPDAGSKRRMCIFSDLQEALSAGRLCLPPSGALVTDITQQSQATFELLAVTSVSRTCLHSPAVVCAGLSWL